MSFSLTMVSAALTGLALPPLDISPLQYGGLWASANSLVFTDLMKHSPAWDFGRRWAGTNNSWGYLNPAIVPMRPDGYPNGLNSSGGYQWSAVTWIGRDGAYYREGRYVVLYDGNGTVELSGDAASPPVSSAAGRLVIDITPSTNGLSVRITASSLTNPVVNIRIVPLANEVNYQQNPFHPDFLDIVRGIPLLRFSSWMWTSGDPNNARTAPRNWAARTTPSHSSQVREGDGVAVEHLVQLANTVGAHMWISLPRAANESDPYIAGMVSYIAANLASNLTLTVEYGIDGPGGLSSHLSNSTRLLSAAVRRAWAEAGRPRAQLRMVMTTAGQSPALDYAGNISTYIDAYALPGSFGGNAYWAWAGRPNPTYWHDYNYFSAARPNAPSQDQVLRLLRSAVIAADQAYYKSYQWVRSLGVDVLGYTAGPDMYGALYSARSNYDRAMKTCGLNTSIFPCVWNGPIYPPMSVSGPLNWTTQGEFNATIQSMALNASREASLESAIRAARINDSMYDIMLDSLWRWHNQTRGGDLVVDLTRSARACYYSPGGWSKTYAPDECKGTPAAAALIVGKPNGTPVYRALRAWLAAAAAGEPPPGALPRSAADAPSPVSRPPACEPACVYGSCVNGSCVCWAGVSGTTCDLLPARGSGTPAACNPRVGINVDGMSDWMRSWVFVDVFKVSRAWIPQTFLPGATWSTGAPVALINRTDGPGGRTAVGYPAVLPNYQRVSTLVVRDVQGHAPGGVYTVLYDGKGALDFSMSDVKDVVYVEAGHVKVTFYPSTDSNNGMLIMVERTDAADPIRNIRVLTPGYEQAAVWGGQPFHPAFMEFLRPFGLIRFMDWMKSNAAELPREWDERPRPEDISYASNLGGVPLEHMLLLANTLGADPWFVMPFAASDDFVAHFAAAVRDGLRPDLKPYVEYGNELWHTGFPGGQYAQAMGLKMNLTEEGNKWYGGATNEARLCFVAHRTANISKIWKAVWGERASQVVVVISGQEVLPVTCDKLLSCGGAHAHIDALSVASYFGSYDKNRDTNLTVFMNTTLPGQINSTIAIMKQHAAIAAKYGKPLVSYEGGQGMTGDGSNSDLAIQANRDPAMEGIYRVYMEALATANVSRFAHYSAIRVYSKYGSWGLMEAQDQDPDEAPKYLGIMSYINSTAKCALPASPDPATCPGGHSCSGNGLCLPNGRCMCYSGFSGDDCSNTTYIEVYKCGYKCTFDQGWCNVTTMLKKTRTWTCTCKPGITGLTCGIVSCPNKCNRNGECLDQGVCACYPGYMGPDCGIDCGCGGHGRCAALPTTNSSITNGTTATINNNSIAASSPPACICDVGWRVGPSGMCDTWDCRGCATGTSCIGPGECGCAERCLYGTCFHGACRCWAGFGGPACNVTAGAPPPLSPPLSLSSPLSLSAAGAIGPSDGAAAAALLNSGSTVPRLNRGSLAGVNLGGTSYWSTEWMWIDLMKSSSDWMTAHAAETAWENLWDTGVPLKLRPDGYPARLPPGTVAHKLLQRNMLLHTWPGRYVVLYDGDGQLDFGFDARVASRGKNRLEIIFRPTADLVCAATGAAYCGDNGIHLILSETNPDNPLRNIRILPSGEGAGASAGGAGAGGAWEGRAERTTFHPWFLKSIARYSVIRFMGWLDTNSNKGPWEAVAAGNATGWGARRTPDWHTQAGPGGIAFEYLISLVNLVGADPWVTVHHLADDAYVTALATLMRDTLRPDLRVYVEHSNEVWNSLFPQATYARAAGLRLNLSSDATIAGYRYHALRTAQIATIFRTVFAAAPAGGAARVKVVLGGWGYLCSGGTGCGAVVVKETLGWGQQQLRALNGSAAAQWAAGINVSLATPDYYGVTAYWDCGLGRNGPADVLLSLEQMLARCNASLPAAEADGRALVAAAAAYGTPAIAYEAGPSIVEGATIEGRGETAGLAAKFMALNRHPGMYDLYGAYLDAYRRAGLVGEGRPFMQFVATGLYTKYGSWGLQEYTGQPVSQAHKYRALMDWLDKQANGTSGPDNIATNSTPPWRPLCLNLSASGGAAGGVSGGAGGGGVMLGEGVLTGPPAVLLPAAGQVVVQGTTAPVRWSNVGWEPGVIPPSFEITLWYLTDCASDPPTGATQREQQQTASQAIAVLPRPSKPGELDVYVPRAAEDPRVGQAVAAASAAAAQSGGQRLPPAFFLRFSDGITTNYSEPFHISPGVEYVAGSWSACDCTPGQPQPTQIRNVTCRPVAELGSGADSLLLEAVLTNNSAQLPPLAPLPPSPACDPFPDWNLTRSTVGDPPCSIDANGCRTYRTNQRGGWAYSAFKPVMDCTAQASPWPTPQIFATATVSGSNASLNVSAAANATSMLSPLQQQQLQLQMLDGLPTFNLSVCEALIAPLVGPPSVVRNCTCSSPPPPLPPP